jgi:hypothetical protein
MLERREQRAGHLIADLGEDRVQLVLDLLPVMSLKLILPMLTWKLSRIACAPSRPMT